MPQFGGKDSKRHFTVVMRGKEHGLYVSSTPSSAARKAVTKLCVSNKSKKVEFYIREITQGSKKKTYGPYEGYIEKLKEPIELKGRVIRYKPVAKLSRKSSAKKREMRGGGEIILKRITQNRLYGYTDVLLEIDGKLYDCRLLEKNARNYINYFLYNKTNDKYYDGTLFSYILSSSYGISDDLKKNDVIVIRMNKNGSIRQLFESVYNNKLDKIQINEISRINNKKQEEWNREWKTESTTSTDWKQSMKNRMDVHRMIGNFYRTGQAI